MANTLVVIVSYNAKRYMQECIESIRHCVPAGTYKIVVVDNASTDGIAEWLEEQTDILLIRNSTNVGFGPACNQAVAATAGTEYENYDVFLLNNDTVLNRNSLPNLIRALDASEDIGAVSAMANYAGNRQQLDVEFDSTEGYVYFGENLVVPEADRYLEKTRLNGFAMLIRRHIWDRIGGFDEDFAPGYYEDDALSIEIQRLGYRLVLARDSFIYHVGSASFVKAGTNTLSYEHHKLFIEKYGFDILDYVYPCGAVISQIPFGRGDLFWVLHLGCGLGAEIKAIRSLFPNSKVFGIEQDSVLRDIARHTEEVYESVDIASEKLEPGSIDLLIVDEDYFSKLSDEEKDKLVGLLSEEPYVLHRLHDYDDYDFDSLKMVVFDSKVYPDAVASMLAKRGLITTTDASEELRTYCGISKDQVLEVSADSTIVPYLTAHFGRLKETDPDCNNLRIFDSLKKRFDDLRTAPSPESFNVSHPITITINRNCLEASDAICKSLAGSVITPDSDAPLSKNRLERLSSDSWNDCAYITASDSYGDYGILGFFCKNLREEKCLITASTFAASALGLESYISSCASDLPAGITVDTTHSIHDDPILKKRLRVLMKGSSNLAPVADYLMGGSVTCEFNEVAGDSLPTKLYTDKFNVIIYSLLQNNAGDDDLGQIFEDLENIRDSAPGTPVLIILTDETLDPAISEFAMDHDKTKTINVSELIQSPSDYDGSSNTYSTRVVSDLTEMIVSAINDSF